VIPERPLRAAPSAAPPRRAGERHPDAAADRHDAST